VRDRDALLAAARGETPAPATELVIAGVPLAAAQ
jgi:hypothetical protein